jgi:hypothetical protein
MTNNGLGWIQRSILIELTISPMDTLTLAAFVYRPNNGSFRLKPVTDAQYAAVRLRASVAAAGG